MVLGGVGISGVVGGSESSTDSGVVNLGTVTVVDFVFMDFLLFFFDLFFDLDFLVAMFFGSVLLSSAVVDSDPAVNERVAGPFLLCTSGD